MLSVAICSCIRKSMCRWHSWQWRHQHSCTLHSRSHSQHQTTASLAHLNTAQRDHAPGIRNGAERVDHKSTIVPDMSSRVCARFSRWSPGAGHPFALLSPVGCADLSGCSRGFLHIHWAGCMARFFPTCSTSTRALTLEDSTTACMCNPGLRIDVCKCASVSPLHLCQSGMCTHTRCAGRVALGLVDCEHAEGPVGFFGAQGP